MLCGSAKTHPRLEPQAHSTTPLRVLRCSLGPTVHLCNFSRVEKCTLQNFAPRTPQRTPRSRNDHIRRGKKIVDDVIKLFSVLLSLMLSVSSFVVSLPQHTFATPQQQLRSTPAADTSIDNRDTANNHIEKRLQKRRTCDCNHRNH